MTKYEISLEDVIRLRDCVHFVSSYAVCFENAGQDKNAKLVRACSELIKEIVNNIVKTDRESPRND